MGIIQMVSKWVEKACAMKFHEESERMMRVVSKEYFLLTFPVSSINLSEILWRKTEVTTALELQY